MDPNVVERLAKEFSKNYVEYVGPEVAREAARANAAETNPGICHSGDACDSNMMMDAAFETVLGHSATSTGGDGVGATSDESTELWNAAWDLAKKNGFYVEDGDRKRAEWRDLDRRYGRHESTAAAAGRLVDSLLETGPEMQAQEELGAYLSLEQLRKLFSTSGYMGPSGFVQSHYQGIGSEGEYVYAVLGRATEPGRRHAYPEVDQGKWFITKVYVAPGVNGGTGADGKLSLGFGGNTDADFDNEKDARAAFNEVVKDAHIAGGSAAERQHKDRQRAIPGSVLFNQGHRRAYRGGGGGGGDSPHWDGNRYAL